MNLPESPSGRVLAWGLAAVAALGITLAAGAWWLLDPRPGDALTPAEWARLAPGRGSVDPAAEEVAAPEELARDEEVAGEAPVDPAVAHPPTPGLKALEAQWEAYLARQPKTILDLQPFRHAMSATPRSAGGLEGTARLVNLNPAINQWYLLELEWPAETQTYHLANARPGSQVLRLDDSFPGGLLIATDRGEVRCPLWSEDAPVSLQDATRAGEIYTLLCDERVVLRLPATGHKTRMETATDFLRDRLPGGEQITVLVRETFYQDAYRKTAEVSADPDRVVEAAASGPSRARVSPELGGAGIRPVGLGLPLRADPDGLLEVGSWYPVAGEDGVYVSAIRPDAVDAEIIRIHRDRVGPIDDVEASALAYMVAFDLDRFEVAFAAGTDHPRLGWSDRVSRESRAPAMPGPDGIDSARPLVRTGIVPPYQLPRVTAAFTAGFKRSHGAFRHGELAGRNLGSHYGFIESGTTLSRLQPGLSTLYVLDDGRVELGTWTEDHARLLPRLAHARQNGVPIIDHGPDPTGPGIPGAELTRYGAGNWSGSQEGRYRTLRAGACLLAEDDRRYLVYGYFTTATPSAMARVFQAYGCSYAMLLDMNALEHTYLALYRAQDGALAVSHLIDEMRVLDRQQDGMTLPRFLAFSDNRDFFYLLRKPPSRAASPAEEETPRGTKEPGAAAASSAPAGEPGAAPAPPPGPRPANQAPAAALQDRNAELLAEIARVHELDPEEAAALRSVFAGSPYIGQGNPAVTRHPASPDQCRAKLREAGVEYRDPPFERICGAPYMAPLYDPETEEPEDATACIDMFEFPNIPCTYPVVWVRASEAARICSAMGKRLCDAHEWEGACAGRLLEPDYPFELAEGVPPGTAFERLRAAHNRAWGDRETWAYGPEYRSDLCAMSSSKSPGCDGGGWSRCGSNTFPVGMFPECRSSLGVYDQHGNAAEHMNLPLEESQMSSRGSTELGHTEMKGSWFIWASYRAHEDACRWRAPYWHGSRVMSPDSHHNYHLGFRCCSTPEPAEAPPKLQATVAAF